MKLKTVSGSLSVDRLKSLVTQAREGEGPIKIWVCYIRYNGSGIWYPRMLDKHSFWDGTHLDYTSINGRAKRITLNGSMAPISVYIFSNFWLAYAYALKHGFVYENNWNDIGH